MIPPPLQASKWLAIQALLSTDEMARLINALGSFSLFPTQPDESPESFSVSKFLETYGEYIHTLKEGNIPVEASFRKPFSTMWSKDLEAVVSVKLPGASSQYLFRAVKPVIQIQPHRFSYSPLDEKFRSMTLGSDTISWGLQFSYPQLFQQGETKEVKKVDSSFLNTSLFQALRRWMRENTVPSPFIVEGKMTHVPIRIGKECFSWIGFHPQLKAHKLFLKGGAYDN